MKKSLTVIVPIFNEQKRIPYLFKELEKVNGIKQFEYLFVDDGSTDDSRKILREELADSTLRAEIIEIQKNQGKAFAISRGILKLNSSHFAILDADLEIKPSEVLRMWKEISQNSFDAVFAYRTFHSHSSFTYRYTIGNKFISHWYGLWFNQVVTDIMCGLKMVPSAPFKTNRLKFRRFALEVEIPMVLWAHKIKVKEIEIEYHPRGWDEGKTIGLRDAMYVLLSIAFGKYYYFFRMRKMV